MVLTQTDVTDDLPLAVPFEDDSLFQRFISVPQNGFDQLSTEIELTLRSLQLPHASGINLDVIGYNKGPLGLRRSRGDSEYRQYLYALPSAFGGQHRSKDVRTAIASGVIPDEEEDVVINEDVTTNSYTIEIRSWQPHSVSLVEFLADYADAPVVALEDPITYDWGVGPPRRMGSGAGTLTTVDHGTAPPRVGDTGGMSSVTIYEDGFDGEWDFDTDGMRFDVEEPVFESISAIGVGEFRHVDSGEGQTVESPFEHNGTLNHDGTVNHD
jgi:hypothetical protein